MIVFSNTTPIIALSSIQRLDLLPHLFGRIHLVKEVAEYLDLHVTTMRNHGIYYHPDLIKKLLNQIGES